MSACDDVVSVARGLFDGSERGQEPSVFPMASPADAATATSATAKVLEATLRQRTRGVTIKALHDLLLKGAASEAPWNITGYLLRIHVNAKHTHLVASAQKTHTQKTAQKMHTELTCYQQMQIVTGHTNCLGQDPGPTPSCPLSPPEQACRTLSWKMELLAWSTVPASRYNVPRCFKRWAVVRFQAAWRGHAARRLRRARVWHSLTSVLK